MQKTAWLRLRIYRHRRRSGRDRSWAFLPVLMAKARYPSSLTSYSQSGPSGNLSFRNSSMGSMNAAAILRWAMDGVYRLCRSQTGEAKIINYFTFNFGRLALCTSMALMEATLERCSRRDFHRRQIAACRTQYLFISSQAVSSTTLVGFRHEPQDETGEMRSMLACLSAG
jgi:hypothetical protein